MHRVTRRRLLRLAGMAGAGALAGSGPVALARSPDYGRLAHVRQACALTPRDIDDPGFVDGMPQRSDIRQDFLAEAIKDGVPLRLALRVYRIDSAGCSPLTAALVDVWHCDAQGIYSEDPDRETMGRAFLRGNQPVPEDGVVEFVTVYPGWYSQRTSHIHFKVRTFSAGQVTYEFTSQFYFPDSISDEVLRQPAYAAKGPKDRTNAQDYFFGKASEDGRVPADMGRHLMFDLSWDGEGYVGRFDIGLDLSDLS
jgi:protocatechuate 3,4-dioxygenase beta subunit